MLVGTGNAAAGASVTSAIRQASQATGTSFHYLVATAQVESGLNPQAGAATSSARGLFQFIDQTWLATMKQDGPALGYGQYADAISQSPSGRYYVADPSLRSEILKLRNDPTANAVMAGAFTKSNAAILSDRLGRAPSEGELYIAHFLGAGGAAKLVTLAANNPNATAADFFGHAAHANPSIFYDRTGTPRTLAQVRNVLVARYDVARGTQDQTPPTAQAANTPAALPETSALAAPAASVALAEPLALATAAPDTAGIAEVFAAAMSKTAAGHKQVFHGLFQDGARAAPVSPVVSALWSVPVADASSAGAPKPKVSGMLSLFKDPVQGS
jgi:Transglycosylase SLT domain